MSSNDKSLRIDVVDVGAIISPSDSTILNALEAADVHIHYHCREGFCGACRTKLIEGEVEYTTDTNVKAIDMENDDNSVDMDNATSSFNI